MNDDRKRYQMLAEHLSEILNQSHKESGAIDMKKKLTLNLSAGNLATICEALGFYDENVSLQGYFDEFDEAYREANNALNDPRVKDKKTYQSNAIACLGMKRRGARRLHPEFKRRMARSYEQLSKGLYAVGYDKYEAPEGRNNKKLNAISMIMDKYGYGTVDACIKALQRMGVVDLPAKYPS